MSNWYQINIFDTKLVNKPGLMMSSEIRKLALVLFSSEATIEELTLSMYSKSGLFIESHVDMVSESLNLSGEWSVWHGMWGTGIVGIRSGTETSFVRTDVVPEVDTVDLERGLVMAGAEREEVFLGTGVVSEVLRFVEQRLAVVVDPLFTMDVVGGLVFCAKFDTRSIQMAYRITIAAEKKSQICLNKKTKN
jgi:hypothetical protein